jgi:O-antigen/teichoic acid export membrane protein
VTSIPSQQVQSAIAQAARPEFRHDIRDSRRAFVAWTDLLILTAWLAIPGGAAGAVILPFLVPVLFGPDWASTAEIVGLLAIGAGLQLMGGVLATAIEVLGRFRWLWAVAIPLLALQLGGIWLLIEFRELIVPIGVFVVTMLVRHATQIALCARGGYLDLHRLLPHYLAVTGISAVLASVGFVGLELLIALGAPIAGWSVLGLLTLAIVVLGWRLRAHFPPAVIARRYGLLGSAGRLREPR